MLSKAILMIFAALLGVVVIAGYFIKQTASADETLVLGTMSGWPPYVSMNEAGEYEGFDIDVAREIARRMNKKLVIKDMDLAALLIALEQGNVDFIMTGLCITKARLKVMDMIPYQGETITLLPLVFWKDIPAGIVSLADLKKLDKPVICVEAGSAQEEILNAYSDLCTIKNVNPLTSILELRYGKAQAVLLEPVLYEDLKAKYAELKAVMIPLTADEAIKGNGIGVRKDRGALTRTLTGLIDDLKREGFMAARESVWFKKGQS